MIYHCPICDNDWEDEDADLITPNMMCSVECVNEYIRRKKAVI